MTTTPEEVWSLLRELTQSQQETDRRMKDTDRQIRELGKQIGGLGEKFGSFTEGLALPSMENILRTRFGMEVVSPSERVTKDGRHLEIDAGEKGSGSNNVQLKVGPRGSEFSPTCSRRHPAARVLRSTPSAGWPERALSG